MAVITSSFNFEFVVAVAVIKTFIAELSTIAIVSTITIEMRLFRKPIFKVS